MSYCDQLQSHALTKVSCLWIVCWCLALQSQLAIANHPEDACPDIHVDNGQSLSGFIVHQNTWEEYPDGAHLPINTPLRSTGRGTAFGYCTTRVWSGSTCVTGNTYYKDIVGLNNWETVQNSQQNQENHIGTIFWPGAPRQEVDGVAEQLGPYVHSEHQGGIFKFRHRAVINNTICDVGVEELWDTSIIYLMGENRCPTGDSNSDFGNPCNAATGNKHQTETDYSAPGSGLSFERSYNSQIPIDFGLGHGWISNVHRRLEKFGTSMRLRRGHGGGDVFTTSGGAWTGPADSKYALAQDATGYTLTHRDGSTERFLLDGKLASETSSVGQTTTYAYDTQNRLVSVTGPFGHVMTFTYNSAGRLSTMVNPAQEVTIYSYDNDGNLINVNYPDSTSRTYHYELTGYPFHALTGITNENGERYATYGYDPTSGKATFTQHAQTTNGLPQEKFSFSYSSGTQTVVVDPAGNSETLTFLDQLGMRKLTSRVSQVDGKGISQTFTTNNNLDVFTDAEGRKTKYTYNSTNQRTSMIEAYQTPQARTTTYEYVSPSLDLVKKVITPSVKSGQQKEFITNYNPDRTIASIVIQGFRPDGVPISRTTSMQYNPQGQVTQIDGPRTDVSDVTYIEYYECIVGAQCGHLKRITNAAGHISTFDFYDAHGRVTQTTDPNGLVTTYTYDLRGRVLTATEGTRATSFVFTDAGQIESVTRPNGQVLTYGYDAAQDLRSITDNFGNKFTYTYDVRGNRKAEEIRDPGNVLMRSVTYTYDLRNRLDTINAAGSVTDLLFDAVGNRRQETDPNSHTKSHTYDPLYRITHTLDALNGTTTYSHNIQDNVTQVQAPNGAETTYVHDDLGNLLEQSSPDTGTTTFTHDAAGNQISLTDARGITINYTYDALDRLTAATYPTSVLNRALTYDGGLNQKGRLTAISDASGISALTYNAHGGLTGEGRTISGESFSTGYGYDAAGQLVSQVYPSSGRVVTYTRDALGRITDVTATLVGVTTPIASNIQYLPFGPVTSLTLGNGIVLGRLHDQQYRVDYLSDVGGSTLRDRTYTYDATGNIDQILDGLVPSKTQVFAQDALDRIVSDSSSYGAVAYLYDGSGNRTQRTRTGIIEQTITYTANSNQLSSLNGSAFTYDAAGNTLTNGPAGQTFTYDDTNRLAQVHLGGVLQATYTYDARGQRVKKVEATGSQRTFYFHYGQAGELVAETIYTNGGQLLGQREYVWLENLPLAFAERTFNPSSGALLSSQIVYLHTDHLRTPRLATNASQQIVWRWETDAYGVGTAALDPDDDGNQTVIGLRFAGQYFDAETSTHYNYFRDYDATTGRYLQSDPLELVASLNSYAYVDGNPASLVDPLGLMPDCREFELDSTSRIWTKTSVEIVRQIPWLGCRSMTGGLEPDLDPWRPRRPPIRPGLGCDLWFVYLQYRHDIFVTFEQITRHFVAFCKDKDECGRKIRLPPLYYDLPGDEVEIGRTERFYWFYEWVRRLGPL